MPLQLFGLTGGIGSGKSTVARRLRDKGLPVIDADELAREVVAKGSAGLEEIVRTFGESVLDARGELDRKRVASLVFDDEAARRRLEAITHPRVAALAMERRAGIEASGEPLAAYEVPLLFEVGLGDVLRPVVVVTAPEDVRVERAAARDGSSADDVRARIRAQLPLDEKARRADYVIDNGGTLEATLARTDETLRALCERLGVDPGGYGV